MAKKKRKKSILHSTFYRVYFVAVAVALIAIAVGTVWLKGLLSDYESAQPKHVASEVARMFETADFDSIYALDTSAAQFSGDDRELYLRELSAHAEGKSVAWSEALSADPDVRNYNVTLDGERFATFTLVPSGETTARGNRLWKLGTVTTLVALQQAEPEPQPEEVPQAAEETPAPEPVSLCRITAPPGYTVRVDGVTLTAENAQTSEKALFEAGFLPEGVTNPPMTEYLYDAHTETPEVTATDDTGAAATVVPGDKPLTWSCLLKEDPAYRQQYGDAALTLAKQVAKFISGDGGKKSILRKCARNSPAQEIFDNLYNRYTTPHDGISFRNEQVSEFYALSEDCFTCHVSFDVVLDTKNGDSVDSTAYTFCVIRKDGTGKLYNLLIY